jgi:hypothetical protein
MKIVITLFLFQMFHLLEDPIYVYQTATIF